MLAEFTTTPVFEWNYNSDYRININQGGTSSGKTYAILQAIFLKLLQEKRIATIVGQDIPNLKKGALRDFNDRILPETPSFQSFIKSYHKTDRIFTLTNGSVLEFNAYQDAQDAKNGKRDILFVNEANGVAWDIYSQLAMRTSYQIFIDYNPSEEFWAHDRLMPLDNSVTFYSNFTHNPFIDDSIRESIMELKEKDSELWKVYGLGKTGSITELVFERVTVVDEMPQFLKKEGIGMDFGYRADPTAAIRCGLLNERDIYLDEIIYGYNMKSGDVHDALGWDTYRNLNIFPDPADPRICDDLKARGWKIQKVSKGSDSIKYGIDLLNAHNLHITRSSLNLLNEQKRYKHKVDKKTGKIINQPVDAFNHAWDAVRYWAMMNLSDGNQQPTIRGQHRKKKQNGYWYPGI